MNYASARPVRRKVTGWPTWQRHPEVPLQRRRVGRDDLVCGHRGDRLDGEDVAHQDQPEDLAGDERHPDARAVDAQSDADRPEHDAAGSRRGAAAGRPGRRPRGPGTSSGSCSCVGRPRPRGRPAASARRRRPVRPATRARGRPAGRSAARARPGTGRPWSRSSGAPAPRRRRRPRRPRGPTCRRTPARRTASAPRSGSPPGCRESRAGVRGGWWWPRPHRTARGVPPREYAARGREGKCLPRHDDRGRSRPRVEACRTRPFLLAPHPLPTTTRPHPARSGRVSRLAQRPPASQPARGVPVRARRGLLRRTARRLPGRLGRLRQRRRRLGAGGRAHRGGDRPGAGHRHRDRRRHPAGPPCTTPPACRR